VHEPECSQRTGTSSWRASRLLAADRPHELVDPCPVHPPHDAAPVDDYDRRDLAVQVLPLLAGVPIGVDAAHLVGDAAIRQKGLHRLAVGVAVAAVEEYFHLSPR